MTRLDELDREELWDVCRELRPDVSRAQFEQWWREFLELKRLKALH